MDLSLPRLSTLHERHPHAVQSLVSALAQKRVPHAYLLGGSTEQALRQLSLAWTATLLCEHRQGAPWFDACGQCPSCAGVLSDQHPDFIHLGGREAATDKDRDDTATEHRKPIGVESVREIRPRAMLTAALGTNKVILIDGLDHFTTEAQNSLLKIVEEPPTATYFVMWSTRPKHVLLTIRSRCQTLHLAPQDPSQTQALLIDTFQLEPEAARYLAPLVGDDMARAQQMLTHGAVDIIQQLHRVLFEHVDDAALLQTAADLSSDRERSDVALALLEVCVRDHLAMRHDVAGTGLADAAQQLAQLRTYQSSHLNRTLVIERLLITLTRSSQSIAVSSLTKAAGRA